MLWARCTQGLHLINIFEHPQMYISCSTYIYIYIYIYVWYIHIYIILSYIYMIYNIIIYIYIMNDNDRYGYILILYMSQCMAYQPLATGGVVCTGRLWHERIDDILHGALKDLRSQDPLESICGGFPTMGVPSSKHTKNYGKSPFLIGKPSINGPKWAIFNSYV